MKQTFASDTFKASTFACGAFRGVGSAPPPSDPPVVNFTLDVHHAVNATLDIQHVRNLTLEV